MQPLKAHRENGQVVLDEPTDLPNGTELYVVPVFRASSGRRAGAGG